MAKRPKKRKQSLETTSAIRTQTRSALAIIHWKCFLLQVMVIVVLGLWVFWPALHGDWLWDDALLISKNPLVHDPDGLWKIWFEPNRLMDYFPLKVSVEWLEWHLWGNDTFNYHLTTLILHLVGALLVWRLFSKLGLRLAWLGGLIFAIHPVVVESVAWISEIKNTLSLPPLLWAMCALIDYDERGSRRDYFLALGLFLAAMLCKTTVVMLPVVILLYAWWKRGRIGWSDVKVSLPFFAVSLALGLTTIWFLHHHAITKLLAIPMGGFFSRLALAGLSLAFYFSKCFWPVGLAPIYPKWIVDPPSLVQFLPWPILVGVVGWLWAKRATWGRHALLGLGFFLINLAPFIGFVAGSYMSFTWVMDHLLYLPLIGLVGVVVAVMGQVEEKLSRSVRPFAIGIVGSVIGLLAYGSHEYSKLFVNEETFWAYTLQENPEAWLAHNNLGLILSEKGQMAEAKEHYRQAFELNPDYAAAHYNLGNTLLHENQVSEAMEQFNLALKSYPDYAEAHTNLGNAFLQMSRFPQAIEQYEYAIRINPGIAATHNDLGLALSQTKRMNEAVEQFEQALKIAPQNPIMRSNLGDALMTVNQIPEAIEQYEEAIQINPNYIEARNSLGVALSQSGRIPEAIEQFEISLRINPNDTNVRNQLTRLQGLQQTTSGIEPLGK